MICELVTPESNSVVMQSTLRTATMALTSVGRHPHIPTLWDAFSDRGRNFFVFESVQGESLSNRMRRTGRPMAEQEVIECSLQMTEVLELLAQQSPPMVHGLISPEHILVGRSGSQYILTNFSIVLAGSATQFVAGIDRTRLSAYTAPEFVRGVIDVRSDLYSLMATAYYAVTGSLPTGTGGSIPQAQRLNPKVSPQFDNILGKNCALLLANAINVLLNCARIFWPCVQSAVPSSLVLDNTLNNLQSMFLMAFKVDKKLIMLPGSRFLIVWLRR